MDLAAGVSKSIRGGGKNVLYDSSKSVFLGNLPFDVTVRLTPTSFSSFSETPDRLFRASADPCDKPPH